MLDLFHSEGGNDNMSETLLGGRRRDLVAYVTSRQTAVLIVPVSITIWLVVWSVQSLTPLYAGSGQSSLYLVADESASPTTAGKIGDSLINALVIVGVITGVTLLMVLLYKLHCMKIILAWMGLSAAMIFFLLFWTWIDLICTRYQIPYDWITIATVTWNFGVVGLLTVFYYSHPRLLQFYLVVLSVIIGWMLTRLPEWSSWSILLFVAVYDIVAVLCPKGPLRMLLEAAEERNEPLPGFIYDSDSGGQQRLASRTHPEVHRRGVRPPTGDSPADQANEVPPRQQPEEVEEDQEEDPFTSADPSRYFKLGLGDFIFYSLLVGRAATWSFVAWIACYVSVMLGLVGTLCSLLFLRGKVPALPALPISIFLGVATFFLSKYLISPFAYAAIRSPAMML
jgi:presenilin 2